MSSENLSNSFVFSSQFCNSIPGTTSSRFLTLSSVFNSLTFNLIDSDGEVVKSASSNELSKSIALTVENVKNTQKINEIIKIDLNFMYITPQ